MTRKPKLFNILEMIVQSKIEKTEILEGMGLAGMYQDGKIYINPNQVIRQQVETLIHESLHAYYFSHGEGKVEKKVQRETDRLMRELYK